ncbi:Hypothetical_protein [Hexamita inflata]|uniref:Hypothetical_protein n=1 Tax=Hexamita inflata TaxID=28002 RepID=A0AA86UEG3_9EUKA|nr:Hypothetical protein HINF_LOCUS35567 [Hexamita inflata]
MTGHFNRYTQQQHNARTIMFTSLKLNSNYLYQSCIELNSIVICTLLILTSFVNQFHSKYKNVVQNFATITKYKQPDSRQAAISQQIAQVANKYTQYCICNFIHIDLLYTDNSVIYLQNSVFETLTVSNGSVERLFSFYHRQTSHFLRRNLDYLTLDAMAYIYVEKIANNINHKYSDEDGEQFE